MIIRHEGDINAQRLKIVHYAKLFGYEPSGHYRSTPSALKFEVALATDYLNDQHPPQNAYYGYVGMDWGVHTYPTATPPHPYEPPPHP